MCAQVADVKDKTNKTQFTVNYYPATEGRSFKPGTCRTVPHTDESLITLLLTSPGECCRNAFCELLSHMCAACC